MKGLRYFPLVFTVLLAISCEKAPGNSATPDKPKAWRFAVVGDTHVTWNSDTIAEMIPYFLEDSVDLILLCGDIVQGGRRTTAAELEAELMMWQNIFDPLYDAGIGVYPVRGNHENDADDNIAVWNNFFYNDKAMPQNGPAGETNLTYSLNHKNALFIGLDTYVNIHRINQDWINEQLASNNQPHIFVFGHEAAFKVFHSDCLDDYLDERNTFWESLSNAGVKAYFCGHDHFFDVTEIDDGDNNQENNVYQIVVGGGGAWLMPNYRYNGDNAGYKINPVYHRKEHGYVLVEISGSTMSDLDVTITWKERFVEGSGVRYLSTTNVIRYQIPKNQ